MCAGADCSFNKKPQAPGMHGNSRRRLSNFGVQLREKQKIKRTYGLMETVFRNYFKEAARRTGITGEVMLQLLESRLDNVVYRLGFVNSRLQARKLITEGKVLVNNSKNTYPSYSLKMSDVVTMAKAPVLVEGYKLPLWLSVDKAKLSGKVDSLPTREQIDANFNEQLVVEFYSR